MEQSAKNSIIRFKYLYRDGGNYKKWGFADFENPEGLELGEINRRLESCFDMKCLFNAKQAELPEVFLFEEDEYSVNADDHCLHEYDSIEAVDASREDIDLQDRTIGAFVKHVEKCWKNGWKVFDPNDIW
ncbi:hypothetical protein Cpar_1394 [Chlorobaculum parvum NCIB 8327]|uniref:Uncharacterized protein n=1 Tax=Chlorobaculum parvum (strain DSM 263 / NCIMB 8327) TaxID=517417 RepID=B3QPE1_CHLP8|nr:hypothetical protein [Chlorobaculum parvum]ACF11794.1 hypothetical protein Cpar_1394 [Chlorobaculum parvum NCIB 8327]